MSARRSRWVSRLWAAVAVTAGLVVVVLLTFFAWWAVASWQAEREDDAARAHAVEVAEQFTATTSTTVTVQTASTTVPTSTTTVPTSTTTMPVVEVPPTWPAGGQTVGLLTVESAGIELPIVMPSVGESINEAMDAGVAVPYETSSPLSATWDGNTAITAHRTTHGAAFRHLDAASVGDPIVITTGDGIELHYVVTAVDLVMPTYVAVVDPTNVMAGETTLRLITCSKPDGSPGGTSRRLVVTAVLDAAISASPLTTVTG